MIMEVLCIIQKVSSRTNSSLSMFLDSFIAPGANGPVMEADEPLHQKTMGQRDGPSFNDLLLINKHYDCLGNNTQKNIFTII